MSKKAYVGVNGIAKNVSKMYVGVNGVPKKVLKGYVGVTGVPKLFFEDGSTPVVVTSCDWWTTEAGFELADDAGYTVEKYGSKIAYYAVFKNGNDYVPIFMSPDMMAVEIVYYYEGEWITSWGYDYTITDDNGITWYVTCTSQITLHYNSEPSYCIDSTLANAAQDLLDLIYAVPLKERYQQYYTYTFRASDLGDIEKTIRKAYGWYLVDTIKNSLDSETCNTTISDQADTIISNVLTYFSGKGYNLVRLQFSFFQGNPNYARITFRGATISDTSAYVLSVDTTNGFYFINATLVDPTYSIQAYTVDINGYGVIRYSEGTPTTYQTLVAGLKVPFTSTMQVETTNLSIDY